MARQIVVDIIGDSRKFNAATTSAVRNAQGLNTKLRNVGKGIAVGAGIASFNLLNTAIGFVVGSLDDLVQAYRDDQLSQELLAQALQNNIDGWDGSTQAIEDYAAAQAKFGFSDDEVREALGQFIGVTGDLEEAIDLVTLAEDLARSKGIDLAAAVDIVTKAHEGNFRALKGLGIETDNVTDSASALDAIQENVEGSAAAWAETSEGKVVVANVKVQESVENIGHALDDLAQLALPLVADAMQSFVDDINDIIQSIKDTIEWINNLASRAGHLAGVLAGRGGGGSGSFGPLPKPPKLPFGIKVPKMHAGGMVQGTPGSEQLAVLQAGERVIPRSGGNGGITVQFFGPVYGEGPALDAFLDQVTQRLRVATGT